MITRSRRVPFFAGLGVLVVAGCSQLHHEVGQRVVAATPPGAAHEPLRPEPLRFEPNVGQFPPEIRFFARGAVYDVAIGSTFARLSFRGQADVSLAFRGENASQGSVQGVGKLTGVTNYLVGSEPSTWRTGIPGYGAVRIKNLYPGIDVLFHGGAGRLEYDFEVAPGASADRIRFAFEGADGLILTKDGTLRVETGAGELSQLAPPVFEGSGARRRSIPARYRMLPDGEVTVATEEVSSPHGLRIDPSIDFSTYLAGSQSADRIRAIAVDGDGGVYVTGCTSSADFPSQSPLFASYKGRDGSLNAFVSRLSADGSQLVFSTYLGGSGPDGGGFGDCGFGVALGPAGDVYVAGSTESPDFPVTASSLQGALSGYSDGFLSVLSPSGDSLEYSTFMGGSGEDEVRGLAVDEAGRAFLCGDTTSADFPLSSAVQPEAPSGGETIAFLTGIDPSRTLDAGLFASTFLGLGGDEAYSWAYAVGVDDGGRVYVGGYGQLPATVIAGQDAGPGSPGAFVLRLGDLGTAIDYAVNVGQEIESNAQVNALAVDASGAAYIAGQTTDIDFPTTPGCSQPAFPQGGAGYLSFVAKRSADGTMWEYASYLGTSSTVASGIALDPACRSGCDALLVGHADYSGFPMVDPVAAWQGSGLSGGFISEVSADGSALLASTPFYFEPEGVAADSSGDLFLGGQGSSPQMVTLDAFQATSPSPQGGPTLAKIVFISPSPALTSIAPAQGPETGGTSITLTGAQFTADCTVALGGSAASDVQLLSATELAAVTPAHSPGTVDVTVTNEAGGLATLAQAFTFEAVAVDGGPDGGPDAGPDAGRDAGPDGGDGGASGPDAGDAGTRSEGDGGKLQSNGGGCGCTSASRSLVAEYVLFALILAAHRRSRSRFRG